MKNTYRAFIVILVLWLCTAPALMAERLRGRIRNISFKSKTMEILDFSTDKHRIFRFTDTTVSINARTIKDFHKHDNVEIRYRDGISLQSIKKMLVYVPKEKIINTNGLQQLIYHSEIPYILIDTRPLQQYQEGHLPTAVWAPGERFSQYEHLLPVEKNTLLVFYSHGVTSDQAPKTARLAELEGYTNVKIYVFGFFSWKRYKQAIVVDPAWLNRNLDPHTVLLDTRDRTKSLVAHIKSAVAMPADKILKHGKKKNKKKALLGLNDKNARIVLYSDRPSYEKLMEAYLELIDWSYDNVVILDGGFENWTTHYPVETSPAPTHIKYERYVAEGSISPTDFKKQVVKQDALILDVRTYNETEKGVIKGSKHIPLSELEGRVKELPRSKDIVIHCVNGIRAQIGYSLLKGEGYNQVRFLNSAIIIERSGKYNIIGMQ
ncbi:MAG: hypothetical protein MJE63_06865 [Proteobacteria bacterium]|nr:hypothetical protein [Pseudomonadota bacterium]